MNGPENNELWRAGLQRELTSEEHARWQDRLARAPEEQARWDEELSLNRALQALPDAPVSSNFTSRVLAQIAIEERTRPGAASKSWTGGWTPATWVRRVTFACVAFSLVLLSYHQYELASRRQMALSVAQFSSVAMPTLEVIKDFTAIEGLRQVSMQSRSEEPDLLEALQP